MQKLDLKKKLAHLYKPSTAKVEIVEVPTMPYLMIDGAGDPNTAPAFQHAVEALYATSYALKFMIKKDKGGPDYGVMPLEGLWWADDMSSFSFQGGKKDDWKWTVMILQPDFITEALVQEAMGRVKEKKDPIALSLVRFECFAEGKAVQIMHIGPFSDEGPTIEKVYAFIADSGEERRGKHHEIYLSDIRHAKPSKWKTIVRQPMT